MWFKPAPAAATNSNSNNNGQRSRQRSSQDHRRASTSSISHGQQQTAASDGDDDDEEEEEEGEAAGRRRAQKQPQLPQHVYQELKARTMAVMAYKKDGSMWQVKDKEWWTDAARSLVQAMLSWCRANGHKQVGEVNLKSTMYQ